MTEQNKQPQIQLTRRSFCAQALAGTALGVVARALKGDSDLQQGFVPAELHAMEAVAATLMEKHRIPGLSVAIARKGRLVYAQGFGLANKEKNEKVTPNHLFRIASVSKSITATTIFRLIEDGKLCLADKVFGAQAILGTEYGAPPYTKYVGDITVDHLLTHTAGGWENDRNDPMFLHIGMNQKELIAWTIANQPLQNPPGTHFAYSNFGFCILGRAIEKLTGKHYAEAVQEFVLGPCGISNMRIAGNTRTERTPHEVTYYQSGGDPYGKDMDVRRMDSHGGWLATPTDLARFLVRVDKFPTPPDILKPSTIDMMTTPLAVAPTQAKGWRVNKFHNWWHGGNFPGTTAIMVRTSHQFCWAAVTNTSDAGLGDDLDTLMWDLVGKITIWPEYDLF